MDYVPLRLGVKIRPDDNYYGAEAVDSYKDASHKLVNLNLAADLKAQEEKDNKYKS